MIIYSVISFCIFILIHLWEVDNNEDYGNAQVALLFIFALLWPFIVISAILGWYKTKKEALI